MRQVRKITEMVRKISEIIGDPTIFTNALANQFLPFVADWDTMTEAARYEMREFWGNLQGGKHMGNYAYQMKIGIFNPEYVRLRIKWSTKGGETCYELGHGIFNANHPVLLKAGVKNWGEWCLQEARGIFKRDHLKLLAEGVKNWGEYAVKLKIGIYNPKHPKLVESGCTNFGDYAVENELGIFDEDNAKVVHDGRVKGGEASRDTEVGIFNRDHPKLLESGCTNFGDYTVVNQLGIQDPNHPKLLESGCTNFGDYAVVNQLGIYDPVNAQVVHDGNVQGGVTCRDTGAGAIGMRNEQSMTLRAKMIVFLDKVRQVVLLFPCYAFFFTNILLSTNIHLSLRNMSWLSMQEKYAEGFGRWCKACWKGQRTKIVLSSQIKRSY